jgi:ATP-dependent protease ClpP protease subunit
MSNIEVGRVTKRVANYSIYDYYLDTGLGEAAEYRELITILNTAGAEDTINLYINGPGGHVTTAMAIINAIRQSSADVVAHLTGIAFSAHSLIFLACNSWIVHEHVSLMIHNYSGGAWGKGQDILQQVEATHAMCSKLSEDIYYPFLNEQEMEDLGKNQDFWFTDTNEILRRLEVLSASRLLTHQAQERAHKAAQLKALTDSE